MAESIAALESDTGVEIKCIRFREPIKEWMVYHYSFQMPQRIIATSDQPGCERFVIASAANRPQTGGQLIAVDQTLPAGAHRELWVVDRAS